MFDRQAILTHEEWDLFKSKLIRKYLKKDEFLLKEGETEQYLSFIVKGTIRVFTYNKNDEDISVGFASENSFCSSYASFISGKPSRVNVQALEDCELLRMPHAELQKLYACSHTGERLGRINAEQYLCYREEREIMLLTMDAADRYRYLIEKHPDLIRLIKLGHIATYLGITPQSLSRIRRGLAVS